MITTVKNGHPIYWDEKENVWRYINGDVAITNCLYKCENCEKYPTKDGHDYCISNLPGIKNACCGHGKEGYLQFTDGTIIRGTFTIERL